MYLRRDKEWHAVRSFIPRDDGTARVVLGDGSEVVMLPDDAWRLANRLEFFGFDPTEPMVPAMGLTKPV